MNTSESVKLITAALLKAEAKIKHAIKDGNNPHLRNNYATLESVIDASKEFLLENDIIVIQAPGNGVLTTRLQHSSGEFFETVTNLVIEKQTCQGVGSALTYFRRYSLAALLNITQQDDDGNLSTGKKPKALPKAVDKKPVIPKDTQEF